jgi:D-glycero-alpha-D-manno-heptose-7-phosphate kinase
MIIARSPLRITLGGGGTDLPSYYRDHEGFLIAAAIDRYVYVTVTRPFSPGIYLKYSQLENVQQVSEVSHPIIKETLALMDYKIPQIEITTLADIPSGTGLGSSGSFTTALLRSIYAYDRKVIHSGELAELACHIEIDRLQEPIGKQDQYAAAFGGVSCFTFCKDDKVTVAPLSISPETLIDLQDNLLLFFTGFSRSAGSILRDQNNKSQTSDREMLNNLHFTKELGRRSQTALESGDCIRFGELMHEHWMHKRSRSGGMSNTKIDEWYADALRNGAVGGKLVGAGGGGFLMFYAVDKAKLRLAMTRKGLQELRFGFDFEGTKLVMT